MIKSALRSAVRSLSDRFEVNVRLEELPEGLDVTYLTFGTDYFDSDSGRDQVFGFAGDDYIDVGATIGLDDYPPHFDEDVVHAGSGNDEILTGVEDDLVYGGKGDDWIKPGTGDDIVAAGDGDDRINGSAGSDQIWTGEGEDVVIIGNFDAIDKVMDFESGEDKLVITQDWFDFNDFDMSNTGQFGSGGNLQVGDDGTFDAQFYIVTNGLAPVVVYDGDGAGAGAAEAVVRLTFGDTIAESDIFVIA